MGQEPDSVPMTDLPSDVQIAYWKNQVDIKDQSIDFLREENDRLREEAQTRQRTQEERETIDRKRKESIRRENIRRERKWMVQTTAARMVQAFTTWHLTQGKEMYQIEKMSTELEAIARTAAKFENDVNIAVCTFGKE